jgi:hypothetical protein
MTQNLSTQSKREFPSNKPLRFLFLSLASSQTHPRLFRPRPPPLPAAPRPTLEVSSSFNQFFFPLNVHWK